MELYQSLKTQIDDPQLEDLVCYGPPEDLSKLLSKRDFNSMQLAAAYALAACSEALPSMTASLETRQSTRELLQKKIERPGIR